MWAALFLLFQVWALVKEKKERNPSHSSFQPFIQQPASILSVPLLGGGLQTRKMWVQPNRWLVNRVIKSACLGAVLAGLDVLAVPIFGLDGVGVGLRVGPVPQPGWLGQGIFLTVTAVLSIPPSLHPSILPLTEPVRQVGRPLTIWVLSQQIPTPLLWPLLYAHISGWRLRRTRHPASWIKKRLSTHPNPFNYSFNSSWHVTPTAVRTLVFFSLYFCSQWPQGGWRRWLVTREAFTLVTQKISYLLVVTACLCVQYLRLRWCVKVGGGSQMTHSVLTMTSQLRTSV